MLLLYFFFFFFFQAEDGIRDLTVTGVQTCALPICRRQFPAALAIDRQEIVDGYLFGFGTVAEGPVPSGVPHYVAPPHVPFAPDSARRLVAALGATPRFELLTVGSGEAALEQMLQARLNAVGFDGTIRQLENAKFPDRFH